MKIITEGTRPDNKVFTYTCKECDTVFEFQRKEAKYSPTLNSLEQEHLEIECPICKKPCFIYKGL